VLTASTNSSDPTAAVFDGQGRALVALAGADSRSAANFRAAGSVSTVDSGVRAGTGGYTQIFIAATLRTNNFSVEPNAPSPPPPGNA
jgi:hypothetical protein